MPVTWLLCVYSSPVLLKKQLRIICTVKSWKSFLWVCVHKCVCVCVCVCVRVCARTYSYRPTTNTVSRQSWRSPQKQSMEHCPPINTALTLYIYTNTTRAQTVTWTPQHCVKCHVTVNNRAASWKPRDCRCWNMSMCGPYTCLCYLCFSEMPAGKK